MNNDGKQNLSAYKRGNHYGIKYIELRCKFIKRWRKVMRSREREEEFLML